MPRTARRQSETGIYHVMLRGINREVIFQETEDYERFLGILRRYRSICGFEVFAWCLMDNHVHLLIRADQEPLPLVIKRVGCSYVYWYNKKFDRAGHLFQDRYRSEAVDTEEYFLTVLRYILQNPIKAGMETRMGAYRFSSYDAYAGHPDGLTETGFAEGFFDSRARLMNFLTTLSDEKAMDAAPRRAQVSDARVSEMLHEMLSRAGNAAFRDMEMARKRDCVRQMHRRGASVRQIAAATGLPKSNVARMIK